MKQVKGFEVKEFTYKNQVERDNHVSEMEREGWKDSGKVQRLKPTANIYKATEDDYEWFAQFSRTTL